MGSKIGIVFAFILSAAAAFGAYFLYQSFSEEHGFRLTLERKYGEVKDKAQTLQSEKDQFVAAKDQMQKDLADSQQKVQSAQSQIDQLKSEADQAISAREELARRLKEKEDRLTAMEKKIGELQRQANEMMRACNITPADLKASLNAATSVGESQTSVSTASDDLTFSSVEGTPATAVEETNASVMATETSDEPSSLPDASQPEKVGTENPVQPESQAAVTAPESSGKSQPDAVAGAKVLTVNRKFNFIVVNVGLKDGLKIGDQLKVVRGGLDSATVQVEKLYDRFSAATILNEDPKNQVVEGDAVHKA